MSQRAAYRPGGSVGSFLTFTISADAGQVAVTYTTSGFAAGWHVQVWRVKLNGVLEVPFTSANATETNTHVGTAAGGGYGWFGRLVDATGELVAQSGQTIL